MPITLIVLTVVIVIWALVEVLQADSARIRRLPKWAWAILVVFPLPPLGAIAWFFVGRPKKDISAPAQPSGGGLTLPNLSRRTRYVARPAPDDDPEFLRRLKDEAEHQRMLRRLEDDLNTPKAPKAPKTPRPPKHPKSSSSESGDLPGSKDGGKDGESAPRD